MLLAVAKKSKSKLKKPPVDRTTILTRLDAARSDNVYVRLRRWIPESDPVDGFVVDRSDTWVLLAVLSYGMDPDGYTAVRIDDVQAVSFRRSLTEFALASLTLRGQDWPERPEGWELSDVSAVLRSVAAQSALLAIHVEFDRPDVTFIGVMGSLEARVMWMRDVLPDATWAPDERATDLGDITRIDSGGRYEDALVLVAGPPPGDDGGTAEHPDPDQLWHADIRYSFRIRDMAALRSAAIEAGADDDDLDDGAIAMSTWVANDWLFAMDEAARESGIEPVRSSWDVHA